ncbi:MAG: DNA-processing protein DprA [Actinophytocola sp.]|uniref:DNA-processing protein DprA n=1 Tax=Actinophytocola sp. TaxID=1872138 RepID=UPI003C708407
MTDPVLRARAYLLRVAEPPAPALAALVAAEGPVAAAARVRSGRVAPEVAAETDARRHADLVDDDFAQAAAVGARLLTPEDEDWPSARLHPPGHTDAQTAAGSSAPPIALWIRGTRSLTASLSSAVVVAGARSSTVYGETVASDFGYGLVARGVTVVSNGAYGIGGAVLRGALGGGGPAVVIAANGVDIAYPVGHTNLLSRVPDHGVLISEYPPGCVPSRSRFLTRADRLALFSVGVVIVEAGLRSGSLRIAQTAHALGRAVMAVPGPITSTLSLGTHNLLRDRSAVSVASVDDIIDSVGHCGGDEDVPSSHHDVGVGGDGLPCG